MRRNEFSMDQQEEIEQFLAEMTFGFLGTIGDDGWPHITPLNYVFSKGNIYFHGSRVGQKMRDMQQFNKVTFSVAKEFAIIPSYFSDPKFACPATSYFKSIYMQGTASIVEDIAEKAEVLTIFMQKLQPEGGYEPISPEDDEYVPRLKGVSVVKITVQELTAKFKFGQNLSEQRLNQVVEGLHERRRELDEETARLMKLYCPHHKEE